jgi:hypothetical protein
MMGMMDLQRTIAGAAISVAAPNRKPRRGRSTLMSVALVVIDVHSAQVWGQVRLDFPRHRIRHAILIEE